MVIRELKSGKFRCVTDIASELADGIEIYDVNGVLTGYYANERHGLDIECKAEEQPWKNHVDVDGVKHEYYKRGYNDALQEIQHVTSQLHK